MVAPPFALRSPPRCIRRAPPRCIRRARRARRARHSAARYYALRPKRMPAHFVLEPLWPPIATTTHTILCVQRYSYTVSPASTLPLPPLPPHSLHIHTRLPNCISLAPDPKPRSHSLSLSRRTSHFPLLLSSLTSAARHNRCTILAIANPIAGAVRDERDE